MRSGDAEKTARDVLEPSHWPDGIHQQDIHDSMWNIAIRNLRHIRGYEDKAVKLARLSGRPLDPWRSILAMALWLEIPGLHDRMNSLMQSYHHQKPDLEGENEIAVLLRSIELLLQRRGIDPLIFSASDLQAPMSQIVEDEAIHSGDDQYLDNAKIGKILNQLGIQHTQRTSGRKQRMLSREELEKLMKNYGVFSREHEFKKAG